MMEFFELLNGEKLIFERFTFFNVSSEIVVTVFLWRIILMVSDDNSGVYSETF